MDVSSQVRHAEAVVVRIASWLRDEEAGSSNLPTPTSSPATCHLGEWPFHVAVQRPGAGGCQS